MRERASHALGLIMWLGYGGLIGLATLAAGPLKGIGALAGMTLTIIIVLMPIVGLAVSLLFNTAFQVLGSAHIVGLPLSLSKIFGALTLAAFIVQLSLQRWPLARSAQTVGVMPLLAVVVLWTFAMDPTGVAMRGLALFIQMLLLFFLIANLAGRRESWFDIALWALVLSLSLSGMIAVLEHHLPALHLSDDDSRLAEGAIGAVLDTDSVSGVVIKRVTGGMGDANWFSYSMAAGLPLCLALWLRHERLLIRVVVAGAAALMLIGLVYSFTRTGFLGLGVAVVYLLIRRVLPILPVMAGGLAMFVVALVYIPEGFTDRFFSSKYLKEGSTPLRRDLVVTAWSIFQQSPVIGHGYGQFGVAYVTLLKTQPNEISANISDWANGLLRNVESGREDPSNLGTHNLFLEIGVEYGLIGLLAYGFWIVTFWRDTRFVTNRGPPHRRVLAICLQASFIALLVCGFLAHMKFLKILWLIAGFAAALAFLERQRAKGTLAP